MSQDEFSVVVELDDVVVQVQDPPIIDVSTEQTDEAIVLLLGNIGPPGRKGDTGDPGQNADSNFRFVYNQILASDTWVVVHNLNGYPNVTVVDSAGTTVIGDIIYDSANQLTVYFSVAFSGSVYLS